jgi:hypothetical protein
MSAHNLEEGERTADVQIDRTVEFKNLLLKDEGKQNISFFVLFR